MIIFIFGFLIRDLTLIYQTEPDRIRPFIQLKSENRENEELKKIRELNTNITEAVISRQGSELVTASFNPEEVFGIRLFEKKTCKCGGRNIFPIKEMPEIFNSSQIAQLQKNRQEFSI